MLVWVLPVANDSPNSDTLKHRGPPLEPMTGCRVHLGSAWCYQHPRSDPFPAHTLQFLLSLSLAKTWVTCLSLGQSQELEIECADWLHLGHMTHPTVRLHRIQIGERQCPQPQLQYWDQEGENRGLSQ